jgi:methylenetetrahydrofolate reductase (NADPH)
VNANTPVNFVEHSTAGFLRQASIEVTGKQIDKLDQLVANLPPRTKVFIALIDPTHLQSQLDMAVALRKAGLEPIPHIPARFVKDRADLDHRMGEFASKAGVTTVLALGGGAPEPIGEYHSAIQLMKTGLFQHHGITRIGIAGHPEGNPDMVKPCFWPP